MNRKEKLLFPSLPGTNRAAFTAVRSRISLPFRAASKEKLGDEKVIRNLANVTIFNAVGLIKDFDQHGPGFASFGVGSISCLMFYDPIKPLELDKLNEIGKKLALENSKHYPAKFKASLESND